MLGLGVDGFVSRAACCALGSAVLADLSSHEAAALFCCVAIQASAKNEVIVTQPTQKSVRVLSLECLATFGHIHLFWSRTHLSQASAGERMTLHWKKLG